MRYYKIAAMALAAGLLLTVAPSAAAQRTVRRIIIVRPVPDPFFYDPFFYGPPAYYAPERVGYVKLETHMKDASVYVDGGYAGQADKLKKFALSPGEHNIELRDSDRRILEQERVAVLLGKTTKVRLG